MPQRNCAPTYPRWISALYGDARGLGLLQSHGRKRSKAFGSSVQISRLGSAENEAAIDRNPTGRQRACPQWNPSRNCRARAMQLSHS